MYIFILWLLLLGLCCASLAALTQPNAAIKPARTLICCPSFLCPPFASPACLSSTKLYQPKIFGILISLRQRQSSLFSICINSDCTSYATHKHSEREHTQAHKEGGTHIKPRVPCVIWKYLKEGSGSKGGWFRLWLRRLRCRLRLRSTLTLTFMC